MHRRMFVSGIIVLCFAVGTVFAADVFSGNWKLNLAKSKYEPANLAPKSVTIKEGATQESGSKEARVEIVDYTGKPVHSQMTFKADGKDYAVKGNPTQDMISVTRIDDYNFESVGKKDGKVFANTRHVVSQDGKTWTMTTTGTTPQGQKFSNTAVFDKQ